MPYYEYRCTCGAVTSTTERGDRVRCRCGAEARRVWGFRMAPVVHEHFDHVTGQVISDRRQQAQALRRASEDATERTGIPHNYVLADPFDTKALKVTDEGLDSTYNQRVKEGRPTEKLWQRL